MNPKKLVLFAVCLAGLLALQIKLFMPFMTKIAASDLFLVESNDHANPVAISNDMTATAFSHCNTQISKELADYTIVFAKTPTNAWSLGNYEYIVNADAQITRKEGTSSVAHYVCRIQYNNGDDLSGAGDATNWSVEGLTGLPEL
jgi:hypothetical protein